MACCCPNFGGHSDSQSCADIYSAPPACRRGERFKRSGRTTITVFRPERTDLTFIAGLGKT
jgi:hypothetical protein